MFPELFCSHKIKHKKLRNIFFILSPNSAPVNKLTPIRPPGESSPLPSSNTLSPSSHNNLTPICPEGRSSPSSRPQPQDLAPASWHLPRRRAHWHRRHADDVRVGGGGLRMTDGHPGRESRGSETGNHQISCRTASVPQSTASHTSSSARRCHRARLCGRCHGAGARSVPPPHTQIEQPTPHRLLHKSSFDGS